ncbi:MAG: S8 family serine peptidase [Planctomycetes bacterium]|nr:S8 family serine peptidase [Planctomycetota bacterium]
MLRTHFHARFLPAALSLVASLQASAQTEVDSSAALRLAAARHGISADGLTVLESSLARYPHAGRSATTYKLADAQGNIVGLALDERGREIDPEVLVALEEQARAAQFGKLDEALFTLVAALEPSQKLPVAIWIREQGVNAVQRPLPEEMEFLFADQKAHEAFQAEAHKVRADAVRGIVAPVAQLLDDASIGYEANELAPVLYAHLTAQQIELVAALEGVERVYSAPNVQEALDIARQTVYAHSVEALGITGAGVRAAQIEVGGRIAVANPYLAGVIQDGTYVCAGASGHSTYVAGILRSTHLTTRGIAPSMSLWAGGSCGGWESELTNRSTAASTWGARAFNCSFGRNDARVVGSLDRYYDGLVLNSARTVVIAAGNEGGASGNVLSPATAYNVITVGAFDDKNTFAWSGDTMSTFTSWVDPISTHSDREKPEISAPGTGIRSTTTASPWVGTYGSTNGTSYAAPIVTGAAVQMMQRNAVLQSWPESVKAILMTTALHDIEAPTRLSEKEGAGSLVAIYADQIVRRIGGNWGGISYSCSAAATTDLTSMALTSGRRLRAVIAWDNDPAYSSYSTQPCADLDLQIVNAAGVVVASSASWDNTYEVIDFTVPATGTYTLRVSKYRCSLSPRYLGWSWFQL